MSLPLNNSRLLRWSVATLLLCASMSLAAEIISEPFNAYVGSEPLEALQVESAFRLKREANDGTPISGISALAWDADEQLLYAVTDRGRIHHLRLVEHQGVVSAIERVASYRLRDLKDKPLSGKWRDAESAYMLNGENGVKGDSEVVIGFEQSPRIVRYRPDGYQLGRYRLPRLLSDKKFFNRDNDIFEAVTLHASHGVLTIPQRPLKGHVQNALFRISDGHAWPYAAEALAGNSVSALEALPDGSLLVMERAWKSLWYPLVIHFKRVRIGQEQLEITTLAKLSSADGWILDNFEGLARLGGDRFVIASDDNQKVIQENLLYIVSIELD